MTTSAQRRRPNPLRELSEQDVLEAIFRHGPITRPQIATVTNLSKATVGAAVDRLSAAGLVTSSGPLHGQRGRSPIAYSVRNNAGFVLGVDIGGTTIRAEAADIFGEVIHHEQQPTTRQGARAVAAQVTQIAMSVAERARGSHERLLAVGVSTPGVVDLASRRVTSLAYNVSPDGGLDPLEALRARFDVPVLIENNINLAALGESWHGRAHGIDTFVFVSIGAGVGMGLVINGELVRGAHGAAGEIAYLPNSSDPFDERHRVHGGLEDEIGAEAIMSSYNARAGHTADSAHEVFARAGRGDAFASDLVEHVAHRLGAAIASVVAVLDPELVVLGGGIGSNHALLAPVHATVAQLVPLSPRIEISALAERSSLSGAIALALREARTRLFTRAAR